MRVQIRLFVLSLDEGCVLLLTIYKAICSKISNVNTLKIFRNCLDNVMTRNTIPTTYYIIGYYKVLHVVLISQLLYHAIINAIQTQVLRVRVRGKGRGGGVSSRDCKAYLSSHSGK